MAELFVWIGRFANARPTLNRVTSGVRYGHIWSNHVVQRVVIAMGSIAAFVAASGAGTHWF